MRVLQVTQGCPPSIGGVQRHVGCLSEALTRLGHRVTVLSADGQARSRGPAADPQLEQVEVLRLPGQVAGPFLRVPGLRHALDVLSARHDVVHVHNLHSPLPLQVLRARLAIPVVVTAHYHGRGHSSLARLAHQVYWPLMRRELGRAAAVVAVSQSEADLIADRAPELQSVLRVVSNGVRPLTPGAPAALRDPMVVCVSRLEEYKRVGTLLEALALVTRPWSCVVVGEGSQRGRLEQLAKRLGVADRVAFAGAVPDSALDAVLGRARVCVQPSSREAFGLTLLEGLGSGCRVVASDIDAHLDVARLVGGGVGMWRAQSGARGLADVISKALTPAGWIADDRVPQRLPSWDDAARGVEAAYVQALTDTWFRELGAIRPAPAVGPGRRTRA